MHRTGMPRAYIFGERREVDTWCLCPVALRPPDEVLLKREREAWVLFGLPQLGEMDPAGDVTISCGGILESIAKRLRVNSNPPHDGGIAYV